MRLIVFDCETTGLPGKVDNLTQSNSKVIKYTPTGEVVQLSALVLKDDFEIEDFISFYCMPTEPISDGASSVHRITNYSIESLSRGRNLEDYLLNDYKDLFYSKGNVYIGYNVRFDTRIVNQTLKNFNNKKIDFGVLTDTLTGLDEGRNYTLDLMELFKNRSSFLGIPKLRYNVKLANAIELLGLNGYLDNFHKLLMNKFHRVERGDFHNAEFDVSATALLLNAMKGVI